MQSMLIIKSTWDERNTFKLIPIENQCPYVEGIFDPKSKTLIMLSKTMKEQLHMVPRLDDNGDLMKTKSPRPNGNPFKEERKALKTFMEYYISDKEDIKNFLKRFAVNLEDSEAFGIIETSFNLTLVEQEKPTIEVVQSVK
jgi:hypothetical protein